MNRGKETFAPVCYQTFTVEICFRNPPGLSSLFYHISYNSCVESPGREYNKPVQKREMRKW